MKEITTVARTDQTDLKVTAAGTTTPDFTATSDTTAAAGEALITMNRDFISSMESVADPSCT